VIATARRMAAISVVQRHAGERLGQFFVPVPREVRLEAERRDAEGADAFRRRVHDAVAEWRGHNLNCRVLHVRLRLPRTRGGAEERRVPVRCDERPTRRLVHRVVLLAEAGEIAPVVGVGDEQRVDLLLADHRGESLEAVRGASCGQFFLTPGPLPWREEARYGMRYFGLSVADWNWRARGS